MVSLQFHPDEDTLTKIYHHGVYCDAITTTSSNYTYTTPVLIPDTEINQSIIHTSHGFAAGQHSVIFYTDKGNILQQTSFEIRIKYKFSPPVSQCIPATRSGRSLCDYFSLGKGTYQHLTYKIIGPHPWNITIGKFSSIGHAQLSLYRTSSHRMNFVTTFPLHQMIDPDSLETGLTVHGNSHTVNIGNDVWIGAKAVLFNNLTIGHGAVIGGESVVRKSVPPYAIVYGNPATVVKYRFPPEVIEKLLRMEWWDWEDERIMSMAQYSSAEEVVAAWEAGIL
mmetsp:Transcript_65194/g.128202  ORF Transcript_65194/g.128202 Transcript_65194/m.128202 type:complete len:280 (-) Transcript_65194:56-895(-)